MAMGKYISRANGRKFWSNIPGLNVTAISPEKSKLFRVVCLCLSLVGA